jgi:hypothetical protein
MDKTKVFVSSTFFDLEQVREDIRSALTSLGHEPLLNEYSSFPILPDLDTIENCKKVVRSCDLLVLIVGGRRGSLDKSTGKPITNVEYATARQHGISRFVFVNKTVMTVLPLWRKNPEADFSAYVDDPQVFCFIEELSENQQWIFTFTKASEICEVLRTQLSVLLKSLLDQKRSGQLDPLLAFSGTTEKARQIALERPTYWEFLLTAELLRSKAQALRQECADFERGLIYSPKKRVSARAFLDIVGSRMSDPVTLVNIAKKSLEDELREAWGPPGQPGDPVSILRAVDRIVGAARHLLEWEIDITAFEPPEKFRNLGRFLTGMSGELVGEFTRVADEVEAGVAGTWTGVKEVSVNLTFPAPPQIAAFFAEMDVIKGHPEWIA